MTKETELSERPLAESAGAGAEGTPEESGAQRWGEETALLERLAEIAHESWAGWMQWQWAPERTNADVERWKRQAATPYAELSEREKESDRIEARKYLAVIRSPALAPENHGAALLEAIEMIARFSASSDTGQWVAISDARRHAEALTHENTRLMQAAVGQASPGPDPERGATESRVEALRRHLTAVVCQVAGLPGAERATEANRHAEALIEENTKLMRWAANRGHEKGCPWFSWEWVPPSKPCTCGLGDILDGTARTTTTEKEPK